LARGIRVCPDSVQRRPARPPAGARGRVTLPYRCGTVTPADLRQAIRFTRNAYFKVLPNGKLRLPKIGDVPVRWSRPLRAPPSSVTVIREAAGRDDASFVVEADPAALPKTEPGVGIDLGLTHFA